MTASSFTNRTPPAPCAGVSRRGAVLGGVALACLPLRAQAATSLLPPLATPSVTHLAYELSWIGLPVGRHEISVKSDGRDGDFTVTNRVRITIDLLFLNVIRFVHTSTETWRSGLLSGFASKTEDDGKFYEVSGKATDKGFALSGTKGHFLAPADVMTNNDVFVPPEPGHRPIVNAKTGEIVALTVKAAGTEQVKRAGSEIRADRFNVDSAVAVGSLFYDGDLFVKGWFTRRGRTVDYRLT